MNELKQYLKDTFGLLINIVAEKEGGRNLPLYLKGNFEFFTSHLEGQKIIWAKVKDQSITTPDQLQKQGNQLKDYLQSPIVFVFGNLETWQRKRLIEKKVGFAEPSKQLYIPELLLQIKDPSKKEKSFIPTSEKLKPPAQCLLLYHLQIESLEEKLFHQIADLLNYSPMTISRAIKELVSFKLLMVEGRKEKSLRFQTKGRQLWEMALPHLASPVRDTWLADILTISEYFRIAGDTALANYSMLQESGPKTWAVGKDAFRILKNQQPYKKLERKNGDNKLEVWHYDPLLLSRSNEVDKLSLYLSMQFEPDERVQGALRNLINEMTWL